MRCVARRCVNGTKFPAHVSVGRGRAGRRPYFVLFIRFIPCAFRLQPPRPYFVLFIRDVTERHRAEAALQAEKARSDLLLRNILPDPIVDRLKEGNEDIIADAIDECTILFSDLVGFTHMCSSMSPDETVSLLSELKHCAKAWTPAGRSRLRFNRFDELLESHGVDKVKTIGDAYMAFTTKPAEVMIDYAMDMMDAVLAMNRERGSSLSVRIGVHTGSVVAGVIGTKRLAYDIWGDAVNTASRMESSGVAGRVNISGSTHERVKYKFACEDPREVEVKGKGVMTTYLVKGRLASRSFKQQRSAYGSFLQRRPDPAPAGSGSSTPPPRIPSRAGSVYI
eukprot:tig00020553_g10781.t1